MKRAARAITGCDGEPSTCCGASWSRSSGDGGAWALSNPCLGPAFTKPGTVPAKPAWRQTPAFVRAAIGCGHLVRHMTSISEFTLERIAGNVAHDAQHTLRHQGTKALRGILGFVFQVLSFRAGGVKPIMARGRAKGIYVWHVVARRDGRLRQSPTPIFDGRSRKSEVRGKSMVPVPFSRPRPTPLFSSVHK